MTCCRSMMFILVRSRGRKLPSKHRNELERQPPRRPGLDAQSAEYRGGGAGNGEFRIFATAGREPLRRRVSGGALGGGRGAAAPDGGGIRVGGRSGDRLRVGGGDDIGRASRTAAPAEAPGVWGAVDHRAVEEGAGRAAIRVGEVRAVQRGPESLPMAHANSDG